MPERLRGWCVGVAVEDMGAFWPMARARPAPRPAGFTADRSRMPSGRWPVESDPAVVHPYAERGCLECAVPTDALAIAPAILAVVLVVSGVGKLRSPAASAQAFTALKVPPPLDAPLVVTALPWVEIVLGVALVTV